MAIRTGEVGGCDALEVGSADANGQVVQHFVSAIVDVRDVDDLGVGVVLPQPGHDLGQELEGTVAGALKVGDVSEPLVEDADQFGSGTGRTR